MIYQKKHMATYYNKATNQTYKINGVESLDKAWSLYKFVCARNGWNPETFCMDVRVSFVA